MDNIFEKMKKNVDVDFCPIPNVIIDLPVKGSEAMEFTGFMMVCFSFAWEEMIKSEGTSDWKVSTKRLKYQKGYTNNKCRKFFLRAISLKLASDFIENEEKEMIIKVNPIAYQIKNLEDLK